MKININYSKNIFAERLLFLFLKKDFISKNNNFNLDKNGINFMGVNFSSKIVDIVYGLNLNDDYIKQMVFPIQNKTEEINLAIEKIEKSIDNDKFKKFEKNFLASSNILQLTNFEKFILGISTFYRSNIDSIDLILLPSIEKSEFGISGGFGVSENKTIILLIPEIYNEYIPKSVIQNFCHELAHLYEGEDVIKLIKEVLAKDEKKYIKSWQLTRTTFGPVYVVREVLANLFSNWKWSLCGNLYGCYWDQKLAPEDIENKEAFLNGDFDLNYNQNYHRVYYMYAYLMKDTFWDYINNNKKIDANFFEVLKEKLIKKENGES
jgi:hypothetical protein